MKVWEDDDHIKVEPFIEPHDESEYGFAYFTIDKQGQKVFLAPVDKDYGWNIEMIKQYLDGLHFVYDKLLSLTQNQRR